MILLFSFQGSMFVCRCLMATFISILEKLLFVNNFFKNFEYFYLVAFSCIRLDALLCYHQLFVLSISFLGNFLPLMIWLNNFLGD